MSEGLSPQARALLDAARGGMAPDAAAVRRMRGRLDAAMTRAAVKSGASGKLALGAKLGALAVIAAGAVAYVRHDAARAALPIEVPAIAASEPVAVTASRREAREASVPPPAVAPVRKREPAAAVRAAQPPAISPATAPAISPAPASATLAREVELVDLAMAALHHGDPRAALRTVATHGAETAGRGQLAEDASAIEVEALCQLREPAAAGKLDAFDRRFPHSAQRARLTAACR